MGSKSSAILPCLKPKPPPDPSGRHQDSAIAPHRYGLLKSTPHDVAPAVNDPRIREDDYTAVLVEPGDAVIFSGFLVHRTSAQGDERIRLALSLRYNNLAEPSFIERGYPSTYKFSAKLDLMVEGFPSEAQVAAFFQGGE